MRFRKFIITALIGIFALVMEFIFDQPHIAYLLVAIAGGCMALVMLVDMIKTLRRGQYGVDLLAIVAIVTTLLVGDYWASLMILIMLTGGESLEEYASRQAGRELRELLDNSPQGAHLKKGEDWVDVPVDDVAIGDIILVKPNEVIPIDGVVVQGETSVNESSLTGESLLVDKTINDEVLSGSINGDNAIRIKASRLAKDSQYQVLVNLIKETEQKPARFVRLADRYAVPFTVAAFVIGGLAWYISGDVMRFAQVLVVASPCPLILAAPIAFVAGMSRSSRSGIVIKSATSFEMLEKAKLIAFDKTGTITNGQLMVANIVPNTGVSKEELLQIAASSEQESTHILARSLVDYAKQEGIDLLPLTSSKELTAMGVESQIDGHLIRAGKASLMSDLSSDLQAHETAIYVSKDDHYLGYIGFKDTIRPESKETIERLKNYGIQNVLMLTGDKKAVADKVAKEVGITQVQAECLPQDKIKRLQDAPSDQHPTVMVGDGVNDAPALVAADVGIAMGAHGATTASENADVVILQDDLSKVADLVGISKDTLLVAKQSVWIGLGICFLLMLIASTGVIPALLGAILQEVIDTISILSALRARKDR